jgi:uncharacterized protein YsxB (DUF464 family)
VIRVAVACDHNGCIRSIGSQGHDPRGEAGFSLACAVVSANLRSFARLAGQQSDIRLLGAVEGPGSFKMTIGDVTVAKQGWYRGASELLIQGLQDVQRDFPDRIELNIQTI